MLDWIIFLWILGLVFGCFLMALSGMASANEQIIRNTQKRGK